MAKEEKQENQQNSSKDQGFSAKISNFMGKAASAVASAAAGAAAGAALGSIFPIFGTAIGGLAGAIGGAVFGRAVVEPILNTVFSVDAKTTPAAVVTEKTAAAPPNQSGTNTSQMTARLGGSQKQASLTESLIETPFAAPQVIPSNGKPVTAAFFDKQTSAVPTPSSITPLSNPAALPKFMRGA